MFALSVTRSRIAGVLADAAAVVEAEGWDPLRQPIIRAIDQAAGFVPGKGAPDAEDATLQAFDALSTHLACPASEWERNAGLTQSDVVEALRGAARTVTP